MSTEKENRNCARKVAENGERINTNTPEYMWAIEAEMKCIELDAKIEMVCGKYTRQTERKSYKNMSEGRNQELEKLKPRGISGRK